MRRCNASGPRCPVRLGDSRLMIVRRPQARVVRAGPGMRTRARRPGSGGMTAGSAQLLLRRWPYSLVSSWPAITGSAAAWPGSAPRSVALPSVPRLAVCGCRGRGGPGAGINACCGRWAATGSLPSVLDACADLLIPRSSPDTSPQTLAIRPQQRALPTLGSALAGTAYGGFMVGPPLPPLAWDAWRTPFVFFTGKGGVGKTTVALRPRWHSQTAGAQSSW